MNRLYNTSCLTRASLLALMLSASPVASYANPQGGVVSSGQATITTDGKKLDIYQKTDRAIIDWRSFDIAADEFTEFHQPASSSVALNRINSGTPTQIFGKLSANGNILIVNPNGVLFGAGSHVDINSLIATTADISNENFNNGRYIFNKPGNPNASIINRGVITAKDAGLVGLVAPNVENSGIITANLGRIHLASGDTATVDLYGDGLMEVAVSDDVTSQTVTNTGKLNAAGGKIALTAAAGNHIVNSLITVKGELHAPSVGKRNGKIYIYGEGSHAVKNNVAGNKDKKTGKSTVIVNALLDVSGTKPGEKAGTVDILGDNVGIESGTRINASGYEGGGYVRIGGDFHG
jgi:filamentous hemagglutinin family protein